MEKLQLKHLAPYLPYKIKIWDSVVKKEKVMNTGQGSSNNWVGIKTILNYSDRSNFVYIPILKPLELTQTLEMYFNGDKGLFKDNFFGLISFQYYYRGYLKYGELYWHNRTPYVVVERLLEYGFDVFGLIEKGLAMSILELDTKTIIKA